MKLGFVQDPGGEAPDALPWTLTVPTVPTETDLLAHVFWEATEDEVSGPDRPETYDLTLRVLDRDERSLSEFVFTTRLLHRTVDMFPIPLPSIRVERLGEHTLEVTLADARAVLPFMIAVSEAPRDLRPESEAVRRFSPTARAERGRELLVRATKDWPAVYGESDAGRALIEDAVHAVLADVTLGELPDRLGVLLGEVAADALVDRDTEGGQLTQSWEVERLITQLGAAVRRRHFGDDEG